MGGAVDPRPALERAGDLALANKATLTLIDVLPENEEGSWLIVPGQARPDQLITLVQAQHELETLADITLPGVSVNTLLRRGEPFVELIQEVLRGSYDMVVKTGEGALGGLGGLFGNTALNLMRKCPCPVWVIKPGDFRKRGKILAAVDPDPRGAGNYGLNVKILQLASALAKRSESSLVVLHALWVPHQSTLNTHLSSARGGALEDPREGVHRAVSALIRELITRSGALAVEPELWIEHGHPAEILTRAAECVDLTVMGTLCHTGSAGVFIGNTAERVLRRVTSSVLTLKPDGFVTPVRLEESEPPSLEAHHL